jgi:hypothetical protein
MIRRCERAGDALGKQSKAVASAYEFYARSSSNLERRCAAHVRKIIGNHTIEMDHSRRLGETVRAVPSERNSSRTGSESDEPRTAYDIERVERSANRIVSIHHGKGDLWIIPRAIRPGDNPRTAFRHTRVIAFDHRHHLEVGADARSGHNGDSRISHAPFGVQSDPGKGSGRRRRPGRLTVDHR